jgi:hypothetical protein
MGDRRVAAGLQSGVGMRHYLAIVGCLGLVGSVAHAGPGKKGKRAKAPAAVAAEQAEEIEMDGEAVFAEKPAPRKQPRARGRDKGATARVAFGVDSLDAMDRAEDRERFPGQRASDVGGEDEEYEDEWLRERDRQRRAGRGSDRDRGSGVDSEWDAEWDDDDGEKDLRANEDVFFGDEAPQRDELEEEDAPAAVRASVRREAPKKWHLAIGPYVWASAVDANVSLGPASVSTGVDFMDIQRHARYGAEVLAELRYGRYAVYGDVMYGVVSVDGAKEVGPLMVTLDGTASSLMIDTSAGYTVLGTEPTAKVSLEARAGVRYQRTAIAGAVNVSGADVSKPNYVDAAADALAGAQVIVRPFDRVFFSGTADLGVYGDSSSTWSAAADAGWRVTRRVQLSLGWRTMTTDRPNVSIVMHGPRAAFQLTF